jgi:hypothetical protein
MKITLPEGYIFDILSIYQLKLFKFQDDSIHLSNFNNLLNEIKSQIGNDKALQVMESQEYLDLVEANVKTFDLVDAVKIEPCLGREVDASNYKRFLAKKALQEKWFDSSYSEVKIGYIK